MTLKNEKQKAENRGFALLIAVIFMSIMLALGLALSSLGYKQEVIASSAIESQYAFYAADAALECALYDDQQQNAFDYASHSSTKHPNVIVCDGASATEESYTYTSSVLSVSERLSLNSDTRCADVTVYKYPTPQNGVSTYIFAEGYDVPCTNIESGSTRFVARGLYARF